MGSKEAETITRRRLVVATSALGGIAVIGAAIPFVANMAPSEQARSAGAPAEADLSKLAPGQLATVEWRGKPVWILRRTPEMIERLGRFDRLLLDPAGIVDRSGAMHPPGLRAVRAQGRGAGGSRAGLAGRLLLSAPCSKFDFAGRVFRNVPAPLNLEVPRHKYLSDAVVLVGADDDAPG